MDFEKLAEKTINKYGMISQGDEIVIGLSGGADSVALLYVLNSIKNKYDLTLRAAHINHSIRGDEAERDAEFAKSIAESLRIEFHLLKCDVPKLAKEQGISEEAAGRQMRYEFFNKLAPKIAVAHHKCDSAETTLINLIRGSGLNGLKGIMPVSGNVIRPLIEFHRSRIEEYLNDNNIPFITDSTNSENIYTRNFVRNVIIPHMKKINSNVISTIFENSRILADDEEYISSVCDEYALRCIKIENDSVILDFTELSLHAALKKRLVIRAAETLVGSRRNISSVNIESVLSLPTGGKTYFNGICIKRSYGKFIFSESDLETVGFFYKAVPPCTYEIPETGKAYAFEVISEKEITVYEQGAVYLDFHKVNDLVIRNRKEGDIFSPLGMNGRKKVKDFLIDLKIPRHEMQSIPVLESDGHISALLCIRADDRYKITETTTKILKISEVTK